MDLIEYCEINYVNNNYVLVFPEKYSNLDILEDFPFVVQQDEIIIKGYTNCVDFLDRYFKKYLSNEDVKKHPTYHIYMNMLGYDNRVPVCKFIKTDINAVIPAKNKCSDEGYDLTIIKKVKDISPLTAMYSTEICVKAPDGYYTEIVPRSSISKSGYIMSNSIGIIDSNYVGKLMICLTKIDSTLPDLTLPFKCAQLLIKKSHHYVMENVYNLEETLRNDGAFGSTD